MKIDKSQHDTRGQLKNGILKEHFKNGTLSCIGEYTIGEKTGEWKLFEE